MTHISKVIAIVNSKQYFTLEFLISDKVRAYTSLKKTSFRAYNDRDSQVIESEILGININK